MIEKHEALLEQFQEAEEAARDLYAKGCRVDEIIRIARQGANAVEERLRMYKASAPAPKPAAKAAAKIAA